MSVPPLVLFARFLLVDPLELLGFALLHLVLLFPLPRPSISFSLSLFLSLSLLAFELGQFFNPFELEPSLEPFPLKFFLLPPFLFGSHNQALLEITLSFLEFEIFEHLVLSFEFESSFFLSNSCHLFRFEKQALLFRLGRRETASEHGGTYRERG